MNDCFECENNTPRETIQLVDIPVVVRNNGERLCLGRINITLKYFETLLLKNEREAVQ